MDPTEDVVDMSEAMRILTRVLSARWGSRWMTHSSLGGTVLDILMDEDVDVDADVVDLGEGVGGFSCWDSPFSFG